MWPGLVEPEHKFTATRLQSNEGDVFFTIWGNLTFITRSLNSVEGNGSYTYKQLEIVRQRVRRLNMCFRQVAVWNEEETQKHGLVLLEHAKRVWPHPSDEESGR